MTIVIMLISLILVINIITNNKYYILNRVFSMIPGIFTIKKKETENPVEEEKIWVNIVPDPKKKSNGELDWSKVKKWETNRILYSKYHTNYDYKKGNLNFVKYLNNEINKIENHHRRIIPNEFLWEKCKEFGVNPNDIKIHGTTKGRIRFSHRDFFYNDIYDSFDLKERDSIHVCDQMRVSDVASGYECQMTSLLKKENIRIIDKNKEKDLYEKYKAKLFKSKETTEEVKRKRSMSFSSDVSSPNSDNNDKEKKVKLNKTEGNENENKAYELKKESTARIELQSRDESTQYSIINEYDLNFFNIWDQLREVISMIPLIFVCIIFIYYSFKKLIYNKYKIYSILPGISSVEKGLFDFSFIDLSYINTEFLFYLSLSYSMYIFYKKWKNFNLLREMKFTYQLDNNNNNNINKSNYMLKILFHIVFIFTIICLYYMLKKFFSLYEINNNEYKIIKIILGFSICILVLFINIKEKGLKSWNTLFSVFSLCILLLHGYMLYDEEWKYYLNDKLSSYIILCTFWISIFFSSFLPEYLHILGNNAIDLSIYKILKPIKKELKNEPNMVKSEDSLDKGSIYDKSNMKDDSDSISVMSHDSTLSTAHITILESYKNMIKAADKFVTDWKEGKVLGKEDERKKLLDEIMDLPDPRIHKEMIRDCEWEQFHALDKYLRKRNMPPPPLNQVLGMASATFDEAVSDKTKDKKFWSRVKSFIKEPNDYKWNFHQTLQKETLNLFVEGEEEAVMTKEKKNPSVVKLDDHKLKKGGLLNIYEERRVTAEVYHQQKEIKIINREDVIAISNRIIPFSRKLSIFDIMNQSVPSVVDDLKKLNINSDSSKLDDIGEKMDIDSDNTQIVSNNETNINVSKKKVKSSIFIKSENNWFNKKRRTK